MDLQEAAAQPESVAAAAPRREHPSGFWRKAAERAWQGHGFDPPPGFEERWGRARNTDSRGGRPEDEKRQWHAAYEAARRRGLDQNAGEDRAKPRRQSSRMKSAQRMHPFQHARSLLRETTLPLSEIAQITRLSIYQVVGIKLKMREEAGRVRRAGA